MRHRRSKRLPELTQDDRDFRYDVRRCTWQFDGFHARYGLVHPAPPSVHRAGYGTVIFMGWTWGDAHAACQDGNAHRTQWLTGRDQAAQQSTSA